MRIAVAQVIQETCSFTPTPTTIERFRDVGLREGRDVLDGVALTSALHGFLDAVGRRTGCRIVPILDASAVAGGPLTSNTLGYLEERLLANLRSSGPIDAMYLSLHGASAADGEPDVEGHLLESVRARLGRRVPVVASFDHHGNVTQRMIEQLDGLVGHRSQPHDPDETGHLAAEQLMAIVDGRISPSIAWRKIPMIAHQEQFGTSRGPMKEWFDAARALEASPGVVSVSPFPLQPWLDVPEAGWSSVVVTDRDRGLAEEVAEGLSQLAWSMRDRFWVFDSVPVEEAVLRAIAAERGVVLLSDTGDSVLGGAPGDSTHILEELLRQRAPGPVLLPIVDPAAVDVAVSAGLGGSVTTEIGGSLAPGFHQPVVITGTVAGIQDGLVHADAAGFGTFNMGRTVLLDLGAIRIVVSEREGVGGIHPIIYRRFGLRPEEAKAIIVKTAANFQHYQSMRSMVIRVDSPGPTTSHLERLEWQRIPRPIYPLDAEAEFRASGPEQSSE